MSYSITSAGNWNAGKIYSLSLEVSRRVVSVARWGYILSGNGLNMRRKNRTIDPQSDKIGRSD